MWMFSLDGGFDLVLGNPPYISALAFAAIYGTELKDKFKSIYETAKGSYDVFVLFIEKGMSLLCPQGVLCYITPNKYLSAKYAVALRSYILRKGAFRHLVDVSSIKVFEEVAVYPVISLLSKNADPVEKIHILQPNHRSMVDFDVSQFYAVDIDYQMLQMLPESIWGFILSNHIELLSKLIIGADPLANLGEVNATSTAAEADEYGTFITNQGEGDTIKIINTGTIDKYTSLWGVKKMTHAHQSFITPYLPIKKAGVNERRQRMYKSPKIIFAKMAKICEAYIDVDGEYASINTNCFYSPRQGTSLKFIGAFCNSKVFQFLYQQFFGALRMSGGYFQFQAPQLRVIPVKRVSQEQQQPVVKLVDRILAAKRADARADVSALEAEIDAHVYRLYGLTAEEIAVVEGEK
jgi:hypothetical protein